MALNDTNLILQVAPLPPTFCGTPQELVAQMVRRMKIVSPSGTNFIFIGDVEPTSNVGPWLRFGRQWWVFDPETKRYVPLDISASEKQWFQVGSSTPLTGDPPVWLRTTKDQTEADPSIGDPVGWYIFNGAAWVPFIGVATNGPTSGRPPNPVTYQQYFDVEVGTMLIYERNMWRTLSGVSGDVKQVAYETLAEALFRNPGWDLFGRDNAALRGRYYMGATKDPGATPAADFSTSPGVPHRAAFEVFGESTGIQIDTTAPTLFYPPTLAMWTLVKL